MVCFLANTIFLDYCSQEEEDWLDALEAGELDDFGRMKQERDTSTMTARQVGLSGAKKHLWLTQSMQWFLKVCGLPIDIL